MMTYTNALRELRWSSGAGRPICWRHLRAEGGYLERDPFYLITADVGGTHPWTTLLAFFPGFGSGRAVLRLRRTRHLRCPARSGRSLSRDGRR